MGCLTTKCARMMALCYALLLSAAFAAPRVSRNCYDYCKSQESEQMNGAVPLECNCEDFSDTEIDAPQTSITLDDTGVYFVPAEVHLFQERFASQPFYISNPAKFITKSGTSRTNTEFDDSKQTLNDPMMPSPSEHVEIFERTETISHTSINHEKYPVYLDLEIEKSPYNERVAQKSTFIEDFEATEQALVECLDFQVLHYTRSYGFMEEFQKFWEVRNLNKYEHLSNIDIEDKINKYCKVTESIVEQSLHEIKQGLPKRQHNSKVVEENEHNISDIDSVTESVMKHFTKHADNPTSLITNSPLSETFTQLAVTNAKTTENNAVYKNITEIIATTYNPLESWPFIHLTPSPTLTEGINEISTKAVTDTTTITTDNPSLVSQAKFRKANHKPKSKGTAARDAEYDLASMGSDDVFYPYIPTDLAGTNVTKDAHISDHETTLLPIFTTTPSTAESLTKESTTTEVNTINSETSHEFNTLSTDDSQGSVTSSYSQVRHIYDEKEVKIPKIITKECQNNTVQSTIYDTEELPNNDFTDYKTAKSEDLKTRRRISDIEYDITGKLYFVTKDELVPVRFIQTNTGAVSLGIDGVSLCAKLVPIKNKKYNLLAAICDYLQNKTII